MSLNIQTRTKEVRVMVGIGPFLNEPGDANGHGLWDPLNMLRTLLNYAEAHPEQKKLRHASLV